MLRVTSDKFRARCHDGPFFKHATSTRDGISLQLSRTVISSRNSETTQRLQFITRARARAREMRAVAFCFEYAVAPVRCRPSEKLFTDVHEGRHAATIAMTKDPRRDTNEETQTMGRRAVLIYGSGRSDGRRRANYSRKLLAVSHNLGGSGSRPRHRDVDDRRGNRRGPTRPRAHARARAPIADYL